MNGERNMKELSPNQRALILRIQQMQFGTIKRLGARLGDPIFGPNTLVQRDVKLGRDKEPHTAPQSPSFTPKKAYQQLFDELARIGDGEVDIEVRHRLPTRLSITEPGAA